MKTQYLFAVGNNVLVKMRDCMFIVGLDDIVLYVIDEKRFRSQLSQNKLKKCTNLENDKYMVNP